jgi:putative heme iron utilization protein
MRLINGNPPAAGHGKGAKGTAGDRHNDDRLGTNAAQASAHLATANIVAALIPRLPVKFKSEAVNSVRANLRAWGKLTRVAS